MVPVRVLVSSPSRCGMHLGLSRAVSSRVPGVRNSSFVGQALQVIERRAMQMMVGQALGDLVRRHLVKELVSHGLGASLNLGSA